MAAWMVGISDLEAQIHVEKNVENKDYYSKHLTYIINSILFSFVSTKRLLRNFHVRNFI